MGDCELPTTKPVPITKPVSIEQYCAAIYCSNECGHNDANEGPDQRMSYDKQGNEDGYACGWSTKDNRCKVGAFTKFTQASDCQDPTAPNYDAKDCKEFNLGPKCPQID